MEIKIRVPSRNQSKSMTMRTLLSRSKENKPNLMKIENLLWQFGLQQRADNEICQFQLCQGKTHAPRRGPKKYSNPNLFQRFTKCVNFPVKLYRLQNWQRLESPSIEPSSTGGLIVGRVIIVVRAHVGPEFADSCLQPEAWMAQRQNTQFANKSNVLSGSLFSYVVQID